MSDPLPDPNSQAVTVRYRNHRGDESYRKIQPLKIWFGATEWHTEQQWLMDVYDYDRDAQRTYALRDVIQFDVPAPFGGRTDMVSSDTPLIGTPYGQHPDDWVVRS